MKKSFMLALLDNEIGPEGIDDYVEDWHTSSTEVTLPEYLGMTDEEYSRWVYDANELQKIVQERRAANALREQHHGVRGQKSY